MQAALHVAFGQLKLSLTFLTTGNIEDDETVDDDTIDDTIINELIRLGADTDRFGFTVDPLNHPYYTDD
jgi:hypothetical protein